MQKLLLGLTIIFYFSSCSRKPDQQTNAELSAKSKEILKKAEIMTHYGQGKQALVYLDSAYQTLENPGTKALFERLSIKLNYYLTINEDGQKANLYADSMLYLVKDEQQQFKAEYANALFAKGDAILLSKRYNNAFTYYYEAQRFAAKHLDKCQTYGFTYRLGQVRYRQDRFLEAIYFFKQAFNEGNKCDDNQTLYDTYFSRHSYLNTIGICFERMNKLDSAVFYYKKSLKFIEQYSQNYEFKKEFINSARGVVYGNLGGVYAKLGQFSPAEKYLIKSIEINDRPLFDQVDALTAKIKLAELYFKFNRLKQVDTLLKKVQLELNKKKPGKDVLVETQLKIYNLKWRFLDKTNRLPEAYQQLQRYYNFRDSVSQSGLGLKVSDIDLSFKNNEQQYQLNSLSKENDLQENYLVAYFVFSLIIITILIILWYNRRKLKKLHLQAKDQNVQMQKVLTALEQSQLENTRMMQIVAHDLRSPLAAAVSISALLKGADLTADEHKMIDLLETSCTHSIEMIADLLNINTNSNDLKTESVELNSLVKYCVELLQFKAKEKAQNLILSGINVTVMANSGKIWRVISNLVVNAIKFSPVGADIEIEMHKAAKEVVVKIKDYGIGIPVDDKDKIFDIFTDAKRVGTSGEHSFGIGLAISRQIVLAHRGDIWFESKINEGSTFYVSLPL